MQEFVVQILNFMTQVRIYHWFTKKNSRHLAFETLLDDIYDSIDDFVETTLICIDKVEPKFMSPKTEISFDDGEAEIFLQEFYDWIGETKGKIEDERASLIDDVQTAIKKCIYRLRME